MNINDIELSDSAIETLYGDHLVIIATSASATPAAPAGPTTTRTAPAPSPIPKAPAISPGYKFLGNNQKKITILVDAPQTPFLPDDQLAFLGKMLEACKMNMGDIAIVNQASAPVQIAALKQQLSPSFILLFGPGPEAIGLPIQFPHFRIQPYDQCSYLCAPSLAQLVQPGEENKLLKSKLWGCLKTLFGI